MDLLKELPLGVLAVVRLMVSQVCKTVYSRTIVRCSTYNGMQHMQRRRDGWRVSVSVGTIVATRRHRYQHRFSVALKHVIVKCQSACCTTCSVHNVRSSIARYSHKCGENVSFSSYPKVHVLVLKVRFELRADFQSII